MKMASLLNLAVAITILTSIIPDVFATQYTAYSLKVAQQRIEQAGENWRQKEPEVANLAGVNKVEGFVSDSATGELILVGQKEQGRVALTLDDLVVALRARFRYNEWPLVSIDPTPDTEKTQMQHIRFEGGIKDTAFGQAMFDADYRLKEMGMGLQLPGVEGLRTYWERSVAEIDSGTGAGKQSVSSRFWFYPINPHVTVREGICVVRGLKVGVFTEVMAAKIDGKPVEDLKNFKDEKCDAFANDVSQRFADLCGAQPSFNRLRGLQELVAVSKALEELEERPDLSYWLDKYPLAKSDTLKQTKVLRRRYEGNRGWFEVSGGVHLTALAMRLNAGDVTALREAVLKVRPSSKSLNWSFVAAEWLIPIGAGQTKPKDIAALFSQAYFLTMQERHADALAIYDEILKLNPRYADAWVNKGSSVGNLGQLHEALDCYDRALDINPRLAEALHAKGNALFMLGRFEEALRYSEQAIQISPRDIVAWTTKCAAIGELGRSEEALKCNDQALEISPRNAMLLFNKGVALYQLKRYPESRDAFQQAAALGLPQPQAAQALQLLKAAGKKNSHVAQASDLQSKLERIGVKAGLKNDGSILVVEGFPYSSQTSVSDTVIEIVKVEKGVFTPSEDSTVPIIMMGMIYGVRGVDFIPQCTAAEGTNTLADAVGSKWVFAERGTSFRVYLRGSKQPAYTLKSKVEQATISFAKEGVLLTGFEFIVGSNATD